MEIAGIIRNEITKIKNSLYRLILRALLVKASYEDIKFPYDYDQYNTLAQPNAVSGTVRNYFRIDLASSLEKAKDRGFIPSASTAVASDSFGSKV